MSDEIEHRQDDRFVGPPVCIHFEDNAGCNSWPCEVETIRRSRDSWKHHSDTHDEWCPHLVRAKAAEAARDALAEALKLIVCNGVAEGAVHQVATQALDAHAPGWREQ